MGTSAICIDCDMICSSISVSKSNPSLLLSKSIWAKARAE
jgi:hypothetical protein